MKEYGFEKLRVWKNARLVVKEVYLLSGTFPQDERFGLISQVRRAAISVVLNIAEGSGRQTRKDQAFFYRVAFSSLLEVLSALIIAVDLSYIAMRQLLEVRILIERVSNQLNALQKSLTP